MKTLVEQKRLTRLKEVRQQEKEAAASIRDKVKKRRDEHLKKVTSQLQREFEENKENHIHVLEGEYNRRLKQIGRAHALQGKENYGVKIELSQKTLADAQKRYKQAYVKYLQEEAIKNAPTKQQEHLRNKVLEMETDRKEQILRQPKPIDDVIAKLKPIRVGGINSTRGTIESFMNTRYHLGESNFTAYPEVMIEKVCEEDQIDARNAAVEEERRQLLAKETHDRQIEEQKEKAEIRHLYAKRDVILKQEKDTLMDELKLLELQDRNTRCETLKNIPKKVFQPPYQRQNDLKLRRMELEHAFENIYNVKVDDIGEMKLPNFVQAMDVSKEKVEGRTDVSEHPTGDGDKLLPVSTIQDGRLPSSRPIVSRPSSVDKLVSTHIGSQNAASIPINDILLSNDLPATSNADIICTDNIRTDNLRTENLRTENIRTDNNRHDNIPSENICTDNRPVKVDQLPPTSRNVNDFVRTRLANLHKQQLANQKKENCVTWAADVRPDNVTSSSGQVDVVMPGVVAIDSPCSTTGSDATNITTDKFDITIKEKVHQLSSSITDDSSCSIISPDKTDIGVQTTIRITSIDPTTPVAVVSINDSSSTSTSDESSTFDISSRVKPEPGTFDISSRVKSISSLQFPARSNTITKSSETDSSTSVCSIEQKSTDSTSSVDRPLSKTMHELNQVRAKKESLRKDYTALIEKMQTYRKELKEKGERFRRRQDDDDDKKPRSDDDKKPRSDDDKRPRSDNEVDFVVDDHRVSRTQGVEVLTSKSITENSLLGESVPTTRSGVPVMRQSNLPLAPSSQLTPQPAAPPAPSSQMGSISSSIENDANELSNVFDSLSMRSSILDLSHPEIDSRSHHKDLYLSGHSASPINEDYITPIPALNITGPSLSISNTDSSENSILNLNPNKRTIDLIDEVLNEQDDGLTSDFTSGTRIDPEEFKLLKSDDTPTDPGEFTLLKSVETPPKPYYLLGDPAGRSSSLQPSSQSDIGDPLTYLKHDSTTLPGLNYLSHKITFGERSSSYDSSSIMSLQEQRLSSAAGFSDSTDDDNVSNASVPSQGADYDVILPPVTQSINDKLPPLPPVLSIRSGNTGLSRVITPTDFEPLNSVESPLTDFDVNEIIPRASEDFTNTKLHESSALLHESSVPSLNFLNSMVSADSSGMMSLQEQRISSAALSEPPDDNDNVSNVNITPQEVHGDQSTSRKTHQMDDQISIVPPFVSIHDNMESCVDVVPPSNVSTQFFPLNEFMQTIGEGSSEANVPGGTDFHPSLTVPSTELVVEDLIVSDAPTQSTQSDHYQSTQSDHNQSTQSDLRISNLEAGTQSTLHLSHLDRNEQSIMSLNNMESKDPLYSFPIGTSSKTIASDIRQPVTSITSSPTTSPVNVLASSTTSQMLPNSPPKIALPLFPQRFGTEADVGLFTSAEQRLPEHHAPLSDNINVPLVETISSSTSISSEPPQSFSLPSYLPILTKHPQSNLPPAYSPTFSEPTQSTLPPSWSYSPTFSEPPQSILPPSFSPTLSEPVQSILPPSYLPILTERPQSVLPPSYSPTLSEPPQCTLPPSYSPTLSEPLQSILPPTYPPILSQPPQSILSPSYSPGIFETLPPPALLSIPLDDSFSFPDGENIYSPLVNVLSPSSSMVAQNLFPSVKDDAENDDDILAEQLTPILPTVHLCSPSEMFVDLPPPVTSQVSNPPVTSSVTEEVHDNLPETIDSFTLPNQLVPEIKVHTPSVHLLSPSDSQLSIHDLQENQSQLPLSDKDEFVLHHTTPEQIQLSSLTQDVLPDFNVTITAPTNVSERVLDAVCAISNTKLSHPSPDDAACIEIPPTTTFSETLCRANVASEFKSNDDSHSDSTKLKEQIQAINELSAQYRLEQKHIIESYEKLKEEMLSDHSSVVGDGDNLTRSLASTRNFNSAAMVDQPMCSTLLHTDGGNSFVTTPLTANEARQSTMDLPPTTLNESTRENGFTILQSESSSESLGKKFMSLFDGLTTPEMTFLSKSLIDNETIPPVMSVTDDSYRNLPTIRRYLESIRQNESRVSSQAASENKDERPTDVGKERDRDTESTTITDELSATDEQKQKFLMSFFQGMSPDVTFPDMSGTDLENPSMFDYTQISYRMLPKNKADFDTPLQTGSTRSSVNGENDIASLRRKEEFVTRRKEEAEQQSRDFYPTFTQTDSPTYLSRHTTAHIQSLELPGMLSSPIAVSQTAEIPPELDSIQFHAASPINGQGSLNSDATLSELMNLKCSSLSNDNGQSGNQKEATLPAPPNLNSSIKNGSDTMKHNGSYPKTSKSDSDTSELFTVGKLKLTGSSSKKKSRAKGVVAKETLSLIPVGGHSNKKKLDKSSSSTSCVEGETGVEKRSSILQSRDVKKRTSGGGLKKTKQGNVVSQKGKKQVKFK